MIVPAAGRQPNSVLLIGEAPGSEEARLGQPFVGRSGREQDAYLSRHGLSSKLWRRTNIVCEYTEGNPDPTPRQIREWTPRLEAEIAATQPGLIVAVGRFAARWFLGEGAELETCHGLPHEAGAFDATRANRGQGATILPIYHPALGLYDNDARAVIAWDYSQVAKVLRGVQSGREIDYRRDEHEGREQYADVTGRVLADWIRRYPPKVIGLDTEGTPDNPWSIQISDTPGYGMVLRRSQSDFATGISALQSLANTGCLFILHNASTPSGCMYDVIMCRAMGLDLSRARIWDTMYAAYLLRLEPQGLKALARRWCGMEMRDYRDVIGQVDTDKQVDYLLSVLDRSWPKPEPQIVLANDGTSKLTKPNSIEARVGRIILDYYSDKRDKDDNPVDLGKRWAAIDEAMRATVEAELGLMPAATFDDIPIEEAVFYAARDPDATLRLYYKLRDELAHRDLTRTMDDGMAVLPVFEEMQATGMPASRRRFESLLEAVESDLWKLQARISHRYFGGRPFNPAASKQVATLMRRRGLRGTKKTKTGAMSTGKKSIEHLRHTDDAVSDVIDWREMDKIRGTFCKPILEMLDADRDVSDVRCVFKPSRTATRRLATENPNLQNIPIRHDLGKQVRDCYVTEGNEVFGAWDESQIEARYAAHLSGDTLLCRLFNTGRDVHAETAARIFGVELADVDSMEHRLPAKRATFGVLYGISADALFTQLRMMGCQGWTVDRCDELIREWFKLYPGIKAAIDDTARELKANEYVRDYWGMYVYLPGINSRDRSVAAEAVRIAFNHKIQGGAQGMIQRSMAWLRPWIWELQDAGMNVRWTLQIHDEIVLRFDEELWDVLNPLVVEALTEHCGIELRVPVEASGVMARTWGGLKG